MLKPDFPKKEKGKEERESEREKGKGHEYDRTKISWNLRWKVVEVDEEVVGVIIVTIVDCKIDSYIQLSHICNHCKIKGE